jgi:hypothetical protein
MPVVPLFILASVAGAVDQDVANAGGAHLGEGDLLLAGKLRQRLSTRGGRKSASRYGLR